MIKDLHENEFEEMVGTFYSTVLGYEIEVIYDKDISQNYVETYELKVLNKKNNPFVWIYGIFKLQHLRKI